MNRSKYDLTALARKPFAIQTKGERIAATKAGIQPGIRSERERQLRARYGLTLEGYEALLRKQHGRCGICGLDGWKMHFYVDHDHVTGRVRGLLCAGCNTLVGLVERMPGLVTLAQEYLHAVTE